MPAAGERVLIIQDAVAYNSWGDYMVLVATKGSIAKTMSLDEYRDFFRQHRPDGFSLVPDSPANVQKWIEEEQQFPFQFESAAPPAQAPSSTGEYEVLDCKVGGVVVLDSRFFQRID